jgi:hypothetical protein
MGVAATVITELTVPVKVEHVAKPMALVASLVGEAADSL